MSTGPRAWTDEIDGSSSFTVLTGDRLRVQGDEIEEGPRGILESIHKIAERGAVQIWQTKLYNNRQIYLGE